MKVTMDVLNYPLNFHNDSYFKLASYLVGGQIRTLVGPSDYTIYGLTNERAQIRSRDPRDSTTWSAQLSCDVIECQETMSHK